MTRNRPQPLGGLPWPVALVAAIVLVIVGAWWLFGGGRSGPTSSAGANRTATTAATGVPGNPPHTRASEADVLSDARADESRDAPPLEPDPPLEPLEEDAPASLAAARQDEAAASPFETETGEEMIDSPAPAEGDEEHAEALANLDRARAAWQARLDARLGDPSNFEYKADPGELAREDDVDEMLQQSIDLREQARALEALRSGEEARERAEAASDADAPEAHAPIDAPQTP